MFDIVCDHPLVKPFANLINWSHLFYFVLSHFTQRCIAVYKRSNLGDIGGGSSQHWCQEFIAVISLSDQKSGKQEFGSNLQSGSWLQFFYQCWFNFVSNWNNVCQWFIFLCLDTWLHFQIHIYCKKDILLSLFFWNTILFSSNSKKCGILEMLTFLASNLGAAEILP